MGTATVDTVSREQATQERARVLNDLELSLDELRARAEEQQLSADQTAQWRRVEELTWLLGE